MLYSQHKFSNKTNTLQINKPIKALLIDLDGTIADSAPDLTAALNISLKSLGLPQYSLSETRQWIGNGLDQLLNRAITNDFHGIAEPKILSLAREE
ncbi:MAG: HAD hydrolase-like protein, partial [Gammaproteobacteria bacterium]